jgi:hypothetical protein
VAILGIESLVYGVEDVGVCTKFFDDFGLPRVSQTDSSSSFKLEEGSRVVLRRIDDPALPRSALIGPGVREVVWGVDSPESLEALSADLRSDREVRQDGDGTVHFLTDCGLPFAIWPMIGIAALAGSAAGQTANPDRGVDRIAECRAHDVFIR